MIRILISVLLLISFCCSIFANTNQWNGSDIPKHYKIWNVVNAFGRHYNVKRWVLNFPVYEGSSWSKLIYSIMKENVTVGYLASQEMFSIYGSNGTGCQVSKRSVTLHLHTYQHLLQLKQMIDFERDGFFNQ